MGFTGTPAAEYSEKELIARFDSMIIGIGQYNRRKISGTNKWSEHSWGNGLDLHVSVGTADPVEKANGDTIAGWLGDHAVELGVRNVLWWRKNHFDHIHVDFYPRGEGIPPLSTTGTGRFKYSDGRIVAAQIQKIPMEGPGLEEEEMTPEECREVVTEVLGEFFTAIQIPDEPNRKTYQEMVNAWHAYSQGRKLYVTLDEARNAAVSTDERLSSE